MGSGKHASRKQIVFIADRLRAVCKKTSEGLVVYDDNFSDEVVAREFGVSKHSVAGLRGELFGKLKTASSGLPRLEALGDRVEALERAADKQSKVIGWLMRDLNDLRDRYNKLCQSVTANRVLNVNHLQAQVVEHDL